MRNNESILKFQFNEFNNMCKIKLSVNKYNTTFFKSIIYDGFNFTYKSITMLEFTIDKQLLRKLKIHKLNGELDSIELKILKLISYSIDITDRSRFPRDFNIYSDPAMIYDYHYKPRNKKTIDIFEIEENKNRRLYQEKIFKNKFKNK